MPRPPRRIAFPFHRLPLLAAGALALTFGARPGRAAVIVPAGFVDETVVGGLTQPTSFAFLPDGRLLITEQQTGKVRLIVNGHVAATDPALTLNDVEVAGQEEGLLGIAVDPGWPARPFVYLYYTQTTGFIDLVRYTASGDLADPNGENLTLASPRPLINDLLNLTIYHQAGALRFGPDGMLYVSLGDDAFDCLAFDVTSLHGEILRLKVDALPLTGGPQVARSDLSPGDNPFNSNPSDNAKLVFAYGLRNPFRFQIDPLTGVLYVGDVGEDTFEEEDEVHAGDFLGWPYREGNMIIVHTDCPEPGGSGTLPYVHPIAVFGRGLSSHAIVSGGPYRPAPGGASNWPASYSPLRGDVFYMDYYVGDLRRITWDGANWVPAAPVPGQPNDTTWASGLLSGVDFQVGPDGSLWWLRQFDENFNFASGSLERIRYTATTGVGPAALGPEWLRAAPTPFRGSVDLGFRVATSSRARLAIYDLLGRRVRVLFDEARPAGDGHVRWDGTDAAGGRLPAGVYLARLEREGAAPLDVRLLRVR